MKQFDYATRLIYLGLLASALSASGCATLGAHDSENSPSQAAPNDSMSSQMDEALRELRLAADKGDSASQKLLGEKIYATARKDRDYLEAMKYLKLAYTNGSKLTSETVGKMYAHGQGVRKDEFQAALWLDRHQTAGGNPDWSIIKNIPQSGYAEAYFGHLNSIRLQERSWLPDYTIKRLYGETCEDYAVLTATGKRIASCGIDYIENGKMVDSMSGFTRYFDLNGREISGDEGGKGYRNTFDESSYQIDQINVGGVRSGEIQKSIDSPNGFIAFENFKGRYFENERRVYKQEGAHHITSYTSDMKKHFERFNSSTGEAVYETYVSDDYVYERSFKCSYQERYIRVCNTYYRDRLDSTEYFSPRGWPLKSINYHYCDNGVIDRVGLTEYTYKEEDEEGNWTLSERKTRQSMTNKNCTPGIFKIGIVPTSWEIGLSPTIRARRITYHGS